MSSCVASSPRLSTPGELPHVVLRRPGHLHGVARSFQGRPHRRRHRPRATRLVAEQIDILRVAFHHAVGHEGVPSGEGEAVLTGHLQDDPGHLCLEAVQAHYARGTSGPAPRAARTG